MEERFQNELNAQVKLLSLDKVCTDNSEVKTAELMKNKYLGKIMK